MSTGAKRRPPEDAMKPAWREVACPVCGVAPGGRCGEWYLGAWRQNWYSHRERVLARKAAPGTRAKRRGEETR